MYFDFYPNGQETLFTPNSIEKNPSIYFQAQNNEHSSIALWGNFLSSTRLSKVYFFCLQAVFTDTGTLQIFVNFVGISLNNVCMKNTG